MKKSFKFPAIKKSQAVAAGVIAAAALFAVAELMLILAAGRLYRGARQQTDAALQTLTQTVDNNLTAALNRHLLDLAGVITTDSFRAAEAAYFSENADASQWQTCLKQNALVQQDDICAMVVLNNNRVVADSRTDKTFKFIFDDVDRDLRICIDNDGDYYFAVIASDADSAYGSVRYAALMNTEQLHRLLCPQNVGYRYWIVLYDSSRDLVWHATETEFDARRYSRAALEERKDGCAYLAQHEDAKAAAFETYDFNINGETVAMRFQAVPSAQSQNGYFAVGVAVPRFLTDLPLNRYIKWVVAAAILLPVCCAAIVLLMLLRGRFGMRAFNAPPAGQSISENSLETEHRQRLESVGVMTSSLTHELNNLLTPIMGYSTMALAQISPEDAELCDQLAEIYGAAARAKKLIANIATFVHKNNELNYSYCSPDAVFAGVQRIAQSSVPTRVEVVTYYNCPERCIYVDEMQVTHLFLDLLINAFQAMEQTGGTVFLSTEIDGDEVIMQVRDTGPGMSDEVQKNLFEPFFTTKREKGTGLGLPIVKRIADLHGAKIKLKSELGKGTSFRIVFAKKTPRV